MKKSYVYKITCLVTGEYYFGSSFRAKRDWYWGSGRKIKEQIAKYGKENFVKEILEEFDDRVEAHKKENEYIEKFINDDKCLNIHLDHHFETYGKESCEKRSASHLGKRHTEETLAKLSAANRGDKNPMYGKIVSDETRAKLSAANRGKHRTDEFRAKISAALRGKTLSEEHRAKISAAQRGEKSSWYGKHHTDETRAKISAVLRGKHRTEETRAKLSAAKRVENLSDETRARMSAAKHGKHWRKNPITGKREWYD